MANPLAEEARALSDEELGDAINEAYREMFNLQFQRGTRQLQNPMAIRAARRQIARLRTIYRERQQVGAASAPIARPTAPIVLPPSEDEPVDEDAPAEDEAAPIEEAVEEAAPVEETAATEDAAAAEVEATEPTESGAEPTAEKPTAETDPPAADAAQTSKDD